MPAPTLLPIGDLARRTGLTVSAIRFYEAQGLLSPHRTSGNQRRYPRSDIRRLAFALIAQQLGLSLADIRTSLESLPQSRAPTPADWAAISTSIRTRLDARIQLLERTRDQLDSCIGCGCLSLTACALYNPQDRAARAGPGPRYLLGNRPAEFENEEDASGGKGPEAP